MAEMKVSVEMKNGGSVEKSTPEAKQTTDRADPNRQSADLVEYQAAQDSAQHHDNLLWTSSSIMWAGSLVLLGFVFNQIEKSSLSFVITVSSALGILLSLTAGFIAFQNNLVKNHKYDRCKEIEKMYGLKQHSGLPYPLKGVQRLLHLLITVAFLVAWVWVLNTVY